MCNRRRRRRRADGAICIDEIRRPGERRDPSDERDCAHRDGEESRFGIGADAFCKGQRQGLWVPAFAGTPSALSWMFSSLHTSVGFAVVGAVVGEYLGSAAGLGYLIQQAEGVFDIAGVFAGMFVLSAFVILIDMAVTLVERRLLVWRPTAAEGRG